MKIARRSKIDPFMVMEALREANEVAKDGTDVIHLSLGQPSQRPPLRVLEYVSEMVSKDQLAYTDSRGIVELRQRIARHYLEQYDVSVDPEQVFVTVGSSSAYFMALLAAFDEGDKIALVSPHYPASPNMMLALGLEPVVMPSTIDDNYQPTVAMLEALPEKPQGLVIASPSNPTGTVIDEAVFKALVAYCEASDIRIISDEIYHGVTYDGLKASSVLEFSNKMIVTNSYSKYYLLPGWRLGWAVMPKELMRSVECLLQNFYISPPTLSQYAALRAMNCRDEFDKVVAGYDVNRKILLEELPKAGFEELSPAQGAFYLYADVSKLTNDSAEFCRKMLHEAHVCAVAGHDFDKTNGHRYVRFSYAGSEAAMREACKRLQEWLA